MVETFVAMATNSVSPTAQPHCRRYQPIPSNDGAGVPKKSRTTILMSLSEPKTVAVVVAAVIFGGNSPPKKYPQCVKVVLAISYLSIFNCITVINSVF